MVIKSVGEEEKLTYNVIALHLDITASDPESVIVTGNASNANSKPQKLHNMQNSCALKTRFIRTRSASAGRDQKSDVRAQYWASLFEYLRHTIYELRQICENDENISECEEVILVLENYTREFHELAKWFRMKCEYDNTPPSQRPNSVAWGVSKSSPGKIFRKTSTIPNPDSACRELIFELDPEARNNVETSGVLPLQMKLDLENMNTIEERVDGNVANVTNNSNNNLLQPVDIKTRALTKNQSVDCSCQTDSEMLAIKKTIPPNRRPNMNGPSYQKKVLRNPSTLILPDKNLPSTSVLSSAKRLSGCTSPKKPAPTPGLNFAAPVFVPGRRTITSTKPVTESKTIIETSRVKIVRSQSDSQFETPNSSLQTSIHEKKYASEECAKNEDNENCGSKPPTNPKLVTTELNVIELTTLGVPLPSTEVHEERRERTAASSVSTVEGAPVGEMPSIAAKMDITIDEHKSPSSSSAVPTIIEVLPAKSTTMVEAINSAKNYEIPPPEDNIAPVQPAITSEPTVISAPTSEKMSNPMVEKKSVPDATRKPETTCKLPIKHNTINRPSSGQWDAKSQRTVASRNTNSSVASSASRVSNNQNYVKNGVPKTFHANNVERRPSPELNQPSTATRKPGPNSNGVRSSYVMVTKANSKDFDDLNARCEGTNSSTSSHSNMVRSKTSVDITKSRTRGTLESSNVAKTSSEERDLSARSRRSSKDTDGWETVTSRSRRSAPTSLNMKEKYRMMDANKRFYEPSPSTSLPSLSIANSKEKSPDSTKSEKSKNCNRNNSGQSSNGNAHQQNSAEAVNNVRRNDSNYKLDRERPIISSTAIFTTIQSKRKKSSEKDLKKIKLKESRRKSSKESNAQDTSETDEQLNEESLRKSKELYEEQISLQKEIQQLQNDDLEADGDSDGTEIDSEIAELYRNTESSTTEQRALLESKYSHLLSKMTWAEQVDTLERLEELIERDPSGKGLKLAKNLTSLKQFEDFMMRWPGRAMEIHQKLSSPSRKRGDSTIQQHTARQAKAKRNREQLLQDKSTKIKELINKVKEVKAMQKVLVEERRSRLDQKLKRAEENRNLHLKNIQEKAHDEAKKQKEIAFINELEAQNKRHDFYVLCQEQEDRIQSILEERQRKQEEKAAKDAAFEERRKAIEAERQEKIEELQEKMRKREERIDRELQEKERERLKVAREKARDREDRLLAHRAAHIANAEELQKKIQQKQENSARRHGENIELIRQRAIEVGTPRLTPFQINKLCSVCNVVIDSEVFLLSHLRGSSHQEALKKYREQFEANVKFSERSIITDAPADILREKESREKERHKSLRKRCKKIRQRLSARSENYFKDRSAGRKSHDCESAVKKADSSNRKRMLKSIKEIERLINTQGNGTWPNNAVTCLERNLFEIIRIFEKGDKTDQSVFAEYEGFAILHKIYNYALDLPPNMSPHLPLKCFVVASNLYISACKDHVDNCLYALLSNNIVQILEFLLNRLHLILPNSDDDRKGTIMYKTEPVTDALMHLCSTVLSGITSLTSNGTNEADISEHLQDVVSYIVCTGIIDKLAVYCGSVHDDKSANSFFLLHAIQFVTRLVETRPESVASKEDCTSLMATLKATELVGTVSLLYTMLVHQDSMSGSVTIACLQLFSRCANLNLEFFQNILGAEGISLQIRHIVSYLLKYCVQNDGYTDLLHQVIEFIGFFAIHHHENQMILNSGSTPTVLQQLSTLPFKYFSIPNLVRILFPTLLACCIDNPQNKMMINEEVSFELLEEFKNNQESKDIPLIKLLH